MGNIFLQRVIQMKRTESKPLWLTISVAGLIFVFHTATAAAPYVFQGFRSGWSPSAFEQPVVAPCHAAVSVKLSGSRDDHQDSDVPIMVEFRAPGVSSQSAPTHIQVFMAKLGNTQVEAFTVPGLSAGCGDPWRVRIVPDRTSPRDGKIVGDLSVSFVNTLRNVNVEDAALLANGKSTTKNLGGPAGLHQGWVELTGTWNHSLFGVPGPMPVKLTFSLLKPSGEIADFDAGHSNNEVNLCCSADKLKLRFFVREHSSGQWKLKITNDSGLDAMTIIPKATFKPKCQ
jgi:hypothetical protein